MVEHFEDAFEQLIRLEGGYVDHEYDRGGKTRYGITEQTAREWGYTGPMQRLPYETARSIYLDLYWNENSLGDVARIDSRVAYELFESGVNCGTARVGKWYQQALNVLRRAYRDDPLFHELLVDGIVGPKTLRAHKALPFDDREELLKTLNGQQWQHYFGLALGDDTQQINYRGWLKRVEFSKS